ncbi:TspO/MBR family protein [Allosalinactinospora lopnorensis]|uniref:TspO/MBR family protein n=1 Tax=Allosalinactinospora lopnorensis TaxID=1352348 RepID=UPI000623D5C6|nr:TspO/MBR family protein [Allosalinactinospora lopnorensis]
MSAISSGRPVPPGRAVLAAAGFAAAVALTALLGGLASIGAGEVYTRLQLPAWAPPQWLFSPAWTVLYLLIAAAGWLVWRAAGLTVARGFFVVYAAHLALNAAWSWIFFGAGWYGAAFGWVCLLAASIAVLVVLAARRSRAAAALLLPYLAWVVYAGALNLSVWLQN